MDPYNEAATTIGQESYFHTGNSGTIFRVVTVGEDKKPALVVESTTFGHLTHYSELFVHPEDLRDLGKSLMDSADLLDADTEVTMAATVAQGPRTRLRYRWESTKHDEASFSTAASGDEGTKVNVRIAQRGDDS